MIIETAIKEKEDTDLLCNTLNAEAGRFLYSDYHLYRVLLRAQAAIEYLTQRIIQNGSHGGSDAVSLVH